MEIRIWVPESWPALRYMLKNREAWIIGKYGYKRWVDTHHKYMEEKWKNEELENKLKVKNSNLEVLGKKLKEQKEQVKQLERELKELQKDMTAV